MPMGNKFKGTDRSPQEMARLSPAMEPCLWYRMLFIRVPGHSQRDKHVPICLAK